MENLFLFFKKKQKNKKKERKKNLICFLNFKFVF